MLNDRRIDETLQCDKLSQVQRVYPKETAVPVAIEYLGGGMETHRFRTAGALATIPMDSLEKSSDNRDDDHC